MGFDSAFKKVVLIEGGYSDNPADSGGKTMYGVTEAVARAAGFSGLMRDLSPSQARSIYKARYWDVLRLDDVDELSPSVAHEVFDTAVNCGVGVAGTFLQRALNALNRQEKDYDDIVADGIVGLMTLAALRAYLKKRGNEGELVMMRALNSLQGARYIELAERREKDEQFLYGWMLNRVVI